MANLKERVQQGPLTGQERKNIVQAIIERVVSETGAPAALAPELIQIDQNGRVEYIEGRQPLEFMAPEELLGTYRERVQADGGAALQNSRLFSAGLIIYWLYYGNYYDGPGRRVTDLPAAGSSRASGSLIKAEDCSGNPYAQAIEALTRYKGSRADGAAMIRRMAGGTIEYRQPVQGAGVRSKAGTSAEESRSGTGTSAEELRSGAGTSAEEPRSGAGARRYICLTVDGRDGSKMPLFVLGVQEYIKTVHGVHGIRGLKLWKTDRRGQEAVLVGKIDWNYPAEETHDVVIGCNERGTVCTVFLADRPSEKREFPVP